MLPLLFTALLLPPPPPALADEAPTALAPRLVAGRVVKGKLILSWKESRQVTRIKIVKGQVDGATRERQVAEIVTVPETVQQAWDLMRVTATDGRGKKIDPAALARRLSDEIAVVVSIDGRPVDKGYLELFRQNVIVVVTTGAPETLAPKR